MLNLYGGFTMESGRLVDIIYKDNDDPNCGNLPKVVIADFKQYRGPPWDANKPARVWIPPLTKRCNFGCCSRWRVPIHLAWTKKNHSFEGQHAGPEPMGQLDNAVIRIMVHLGDRRDETNNPGLTSHTPH
jgi:hypothetical protein